MTMRRCLEEYKPVKGTLESRSTHSERVSNATRKPLERKEEFREYISMHETLTTGDLHQLQKSFAGGSPKIQAEKHFGGSGEKMYFETFYS